MSSEPIHETHVQSETADAGQKSVLQNIDPSSEIHVDWYEGVWIKLSIALIVIFFAVITVSSFAYGIQVPSAFQRINPNELEQTAFAQPQLRELAPGKYEAYMTAQTWSFLPGEIRIPAGSTVTFYITSRDVQHGFKLQGTNINMMILPGQISTLTATFAEPGVHNFICHEYCGVGAGNMIGHHTMYGQLIVEAPVGSSEETAAAE